MRRVHVVVPAGIDDPDRPSGGNVYDRRVCDALTSRGWDVVLTEVAGRWPEDDRENSRRLAVYLSGLPQDALVLVDGLVGSAVPDVLEPVAARLRLVLLVHMPLDDDRERRTLQAVRAVVTTSASTRRWLLERSALGASKVWVAVPGTQAGPVGIPDPTGCRLLAVGPVARHKGSDVLAAALHKLYDLDWRLTWVGSREVDPDAVEKARTERRWRLSGPFRAVEMGACYATSDLLVLPSRAETYGMAVAEALGHGVPVVASDVGGVAEAFGTTSAGPPGRLVLVGDIAALALTLREWLTDPGLREQWRAAALARREELPTWSDTADQVERALLGAAA